MTTPNALNDRKTRIQHVKAFLTDHPQETITTASRIYRLSRTTLNSSISATPKPLRKGGQNRILTRSQEQSLNRFIQSYLNYSQLPTRGVVLSAITYLQKLDGKPRPSNS